jgi:FKBP-type peptidyl-prolyl cis-trans isomerase 2
MLQAMTPNGPVNVTVLAVNEDTVTLDANHPLSGKKLIFELEVVSVVGV